MRTDPSEQELRDWLLQIGNGSLAKNSGEHKIEIPSKIVAAELNEIIDFCYPPELFTSPLENNRSIAENALLCPTNVDVEEINDIALQRMVGKEETLYSIDEPLQSADAGWFAFPAEQNIETLHNEMPSGFPPHVLKLKVCHSFFF